MDTYLSLSLSLSLDMFVHQNKQAFCSKPDKVLGLYVRISGPDHHYGADEDSREIKLLTAKAFERTQG